MTQDNYHFIGIGGIGMSGLAQILIQQGEKVTGSDIRETQIIKNLIDIGAKINIGHENSNFTENTKVVFSSAISKNNPEYENAVKLKCNMMHRSDLLSYLMKGKKNLLVTGTHGKTTISSLLSCVLMNAGYDPSFMVGGIVKNFDTNARYGNSDYFVSEADESDGSFLKYKGFGAIISNIEKDHMEYWETEEKLKKGFFDFINNISSKNHLLWCYDDPILQKMNPQGISYGFSDKSDVVITKVRQNELSMIFDIKFEDIKYENIIIPLAGYHNVLNAAAVFCLCLKLGISKEIIQKTYISFLGTKRRLHLNGEVKKVKFYDDYAHHPTAIKKTVCALKNAFKEKRLIVLFQPHRYTRTQLLYDEFVNAFNDADKLFITDLYAAHENPIENISSENLSKSIKDTGLDCSFVKKEDAVFAIRNYLRPHDIFVTVGAGDITYIGDNIFDEYSKNSNKLKASVLFGGISSEHDISILSASYIEKCLNRKLYDVNLFYVSNEGIFEKTDKIEKKITKRSTRITPEILDELSRSDVCLPIMHGPYGEDGMLQGFLEVLNIAYVGCDYRSCVLSMNKAISKYIVVSHSNINTAKFMYVLTSEWKEEKNVVLNKLDNLKYPLFIKPTHLGSSVGIQVVYDKIKIEETIDEVFKVDDSIIIEEKVTGQEIEFAVLGNDNVKVAEAGEILSNGGFYDYDKKYGNNPMKTQIPANISEEKMVEGKLLAKKVYQLCSCSGLARVDFFLDEEGTYWFNELNPIPGFTSISLYPKCWEYSQKTGTELIDELIVLAMDKKRTSIV